MEWKEIQRDKCEECHENPVDGILEFAGKELKLCNKCCIKINPKLLTKIGSDVIVRSIPRLKEYKDGRLKAYKEAEEWVKSQPGQFTTKQQFIQKFPFMEGTQGRIKAGRFAGSKLRTVRVSYNYKKHKFILYNSPWKKGKPKQEEFNELVSKRLGKEWTIHEFITGKKEEPKKKKEKKIFKDKIDRKEEWVKNQPGGIVTKNEFVQKFYPNRDPNHVRVNRKNNKLRSVIVQAKGVRKYVVYDIPQSLIEKGYMNSIDFEMFVSKRIGKDWYLPASPNKPRTELQPIIREQKLLQQKQDDKIEELLTTDRLDIPIEVEVYRDLIEFLYNKLTSSPFVPICLTWFDLNKYYGFENFQDFGVFTYLWTKYHKQINKAFGFRVKVTIRSKKHSLVFEKST